MVSYFSCKWKTKYSITDRKLYVPVVNLSTQDNAKLLKVKSNMRTYYNIRKIAAGQGDDYTTGCLLDYNYLNKHYKMIAIDISKQKALEADPKAIKQINFTGNLERDNGATMFFIIEEAKETALDFLQGTVKVL